jgi:alkylhydroperoxidase/carboxymuconolactone decarboxylase family protein YurZ
MGTEPQVSNAFISFAQNAPEHQKAWMEMVAGLSNASKLDKKTAALAYLAVLAVMRLDSGIPFHVQHAKKLGATREEVISAVLVGLPAAGNVVTAAVPIAVAAYDKE